MALASGIILNVPQSIPQPVRNDGGSKNHDSCHCTDTGISRSDKPSFSSLKSHLKTLFHETAVPKKNDAIRGEGTTANHDNCHCSTPKDAFAAKNKNNNQLVQNHDVCFI